MRLRTWILGLGLLIASSDATATTVREPPDFAEMKKQAKFIGIIEVVEVPQEPAGGFLAEKPPTVTVKVVESWMGAAKETSHSYLWDGDFIRPEDFITLSLPMPKITEQRITLPAKGAQYVVFVEARPEGVWRDIYGWLRRPILQHLPAGHADGVPWTWWARDQHCLRSNPLEEIPRTSDSYGRQKFIYTTEPDDARTRSALGLTDISDKGDYWILAIGSAVKMTVTAVRTNPEWPMKYVVQKGDTLWQIANTHYNDYGMAAYIAKANNIKDAGKIQTGMVLTLPPVPKEK